MLPGRSLEEATKTHVIASLNLISIFLGPIANGLFEFELIEFVQANYGDCQPILSSILRNSVCDVSVVDRLNRFFLRAKTPMEKFACIEAFADRKPRCYSLANQVTQLALGSATGSGATSPWLTDYDRVSHYF